MLSVEDWAEIRRLYRAEGLPEKVIARVLGISVNTVKAALACDGSLRSSCRGVGSDPQAGVVAGADHDLCVLALAVGPADSEPAC